MMLGEDKILLNPRPVTGTRADFDLSSLKAAYQELAEYLKAPVEQIARDYWQRRGNKDRLQQIERTDSESILLEYYRDTPDYIYELMLWEAEKDKQRRFKQLYLFCKKFNIKKILDFGGGAGGLCIYLNNRGLECDYLDIPGTTYNFARWRFDKYKVVVNVLSAFEELSPQGYDAVIAYDVFEHIFDLPSALKRINAYLRNEGYLISKNTFSGGGLHLSKNNIYQDFQRFNQLLKDSGFNFIGQLKPDRFSRMLNKLGFKYLLMFIRLSRREKYGGNFIIHKRAIE